MPVSKEQKFDQESDALDAVIQWVNPELSNGMNSDLTGTTDCQVVDQ